MENTFGVIIAIHTFLSNEHHTYLASIFSAELLSGTKDLSKISWENICTALRMDYLFIERFIYFLIVSSSGGLDAKKLSKDMKNKFL